MSALLAAGAELGSTLFNAFSAGNMNKKNRKWQEKMWHMNNEYNSPVMQMQRFKEAGLNPHLIYGQGNSGNASMASLPQQETPKVDFADAISTYVATKKQQTEIDNLEKTKEVMESQIQLNNANSTKALSDSAKTTVDTKLARELFETNVASAIANLKNTQDSNIKLMLEIENLKSQKKLTDNQAVKVLQDVNESKERIKNMQVERNYKGLEIELKKWEINIRRNGQNPNDPTWQKFLFELFQAPKAKADLGGILDGFNPLKAGADAADKVKSAFKSLWK